MGVDFGAEIGEIDVAIFEAGDGDDFESGHDGAGRVRSVSRGRDETDVAGGLAACVGLARLAVVLVGLRPGRGDQCLGAGQRRRHAHRRHRSA